MDPQGAETPLLAEALRVYLSELENADPPDLDELCERHRGIASELRAVHGQWHEIAAILDDSRRKESLAKRIARHLYDDVDASDATPAEGELISRLATRTSSYARYRIRGEIGRGGMGVVLRVWDEDLRRHLAMKIVLPRDRSKDRSTASERRAISRFLEEAQITGQLDHPGIVPVHELGLDSSGRAYFTMKLVRGESLATIFQRAHESVPPWNLPRVVGVLVKVCEATAYAHAKGVVHRDLKPANIMVGQFGEVYVTDWGLARVLDRPASDDTALAADDSDPPSQLETVRSARGGDTFHGQVLGTPAYMCPEQAAGRVREVSRSWDVYSLGAMLYHLLAGVPPHEVKGGRRNPREVLSRVLAGPPRELVEVAPAAPVELVAVCRKAMSRSPADRYASADELGEDLRSWLEGRVVTAHSAGPWARARKWVRRNRAWVAALLVALSLVLSGWTVHSRSLAAQNRELELANFDTDDLLCAALEVDSRKLGPAVPANLHAYEDWLARAREFESQFELNRETELARFRRSRAGADRDSAAPLPSAPAIAVALEHFEEFVGPGGALEQIEDALNTARSLESSTRTGVLAIEAWDKARASISNKSECPAYEGMILEPQWGLVPLRQDPASELWEFLHFASGAEPQENDEAGYHMEKGSGIVLVLIPGGGVIEGRVEKLDPYFLSKYELTRAQWRRIAGSYPSSSSPKTYFAGVDGAALLPAYEVERRDAVHVLELVALTLPTETQWEHAARGGGESARWTGADADSLQGAENVEDFPAAGLSRASHAPVGSLRPNRFGLYDMLGNVGEHCLDWFDGTGDYSNVGAKRVPATGERNSLTRSSSIVRGGSFETSAARAQASLGEVVGADESFARVGVRPARMLDPGSWRY